MRFRTLVYIDRDSIKYLKNDSMKKPICLDFTGKIDVHLLKDFFCLITPNDILIASLKVLYFTYFYLHLGGLWCHNESYLPAFVKCYCFISVHQSNLIPFTCSAYLYNIGIACDPLYRMIFSLILGRCYCTLVATISWLLLS